MGLWRGTSPFGEKLMCFSFKLLSALIFMKVEAVEIILYSKDFFSPNNIHHLFTNKHKCASWQRETGVQVPQLP
jgi:hypothetical protein